MLLAKEQRIAATILIGVALIAWFVAAFWPSPQLPEVTDEPQDSVVYAHKKHRTWEEIKDSLRRVNAAHFAEWAVERQRMYDSAHLADSLWRDSVGWRYTKRIKKDTIIDLNHTDTTELQFIRGVGSYNATQIMRYGEQLGGYYSPLQLTDEALAKCHLDTLLAHFTADAADVKTIRVNSCSVEILNRHPYLRYEQAKAIYTLRRQRITLHSIEELQALPELSEDDIARLAPYLSFE
ncbi:MAG: helix-hairpin-helix domain-containing protein [Paludibacteraceae bacterium]|nr:helix-hairpin-helix domain-containing protein [Paludibacteraceae bacterium]